MSHISRISRIQQKLKTEFNPQVLEVIDESAAHHGHAGWREEGETHIKIRIGAAAFVGTPHLQTHRAIHAVLAEELAGGLHALSIDIVPIQ
ncbi:MAG: BolA family transcriptional regulator [Proteobacteria bacterium]|nr:BolA family transcriptional regulator [Pseudomonadota bacterium]